MAKKYILLLLVSLLILNGCVSNPVKNDSNYNDVTTDFKLATSRLTTYEFCQKIDPNTTIYVTDFVNESNLENRSQLGFLLSNQVKVNLLKSNCTKNVSIKAFNLANNLKIGNNGAKILSRDLKDLKIQSIEDDKQIVVGSYIITNKQLILFLKLINLSDGNTVISSTSSLGITSEIEALEGIVNTEEKPFIRKPFHL